MGLLAAGIPLDWEASLPHHAFIKEQGIIQFLHLYNVFKHRHADVFLWGDEVEMMIVEMKKEIVTASASTTAEAKLSNGTLSPASATAATAIVTPQLSLRGHLILEELTALVAAQAKSHNNTLAVGVCPESAAFLPEYGKHMLESTPGTPYSYLLSHLSCVERNMNYRRKTVESLLHDNERLLTITAFPTMGTADSTSSLPQAAHSLDAVDGVTAVSLAATMHDHSAVSPVEALDAIILLNNTTPQPDVGHVTRSAYLPDDVISPHPRFSTLTRNVRIRRGTKVDIRVPMFIDTHTQQHITALLQQAGQQPHSSVPADIDHTNTIHMDAMGFGMGMCCLQTTFQCRSVTEARHLYDMLAVVAPVMMALTAATPMFRGRLADIDTRWTVISQSVDDRTDVERGVKKATAAATAGAPCCPPHVVMLPEFTLLQPSNSSSSCVTPDVRCASTPSIERIVSEEQLINVSTASCCIPDNSKLLLPYSFHRTHRVFKSRYDSISLFIGGNDLLSSDSSNTNSSSSNSSHDNSHSSMYRHEYNDLPLEIHAASYQTLLDSNIDELLARHVAHLFIRDPLAIYSDRLALDYDDDDTTATAAAASATTATPSTASPSPPRAPSTSEMFENLQSTNWQSVRFKPPTGPKVLTMGWRVEFRTMEVQLTDYENAAATVFVSLLSRALLAYGTNLYTPISRVDDNIRRAHSRDAVKQQQFYWRNQHSSSSTDNSYSEMTIDRIMNGDGAAAGGLIALVRQYLHDQKADAHTLAVVEPYLVLLSARSAGTLMTTAVFLRQFVQHHPLYQHDSIITAELCADVVEVCYGITKGTIHAPELLGDYCSAGNSRFAVVLTVKDKQSVADMVALLQKRKLHTHRDNL